jgi:hypothetical protein
MQNLRAAIGRWGWAAGVGLVLLSAAGCGSGGTYPVSGKLVYEDNQQPATELAGFEVTFTSQEMGKRATGKIQEDGTFRLTSTRPDDGAFPGHYQVVLTQPHPLPERETRSPVVDVIYEDPGKTPLTADVDPKANNEFTFALRRYTGPPQGKKR